MAKLDIDHDGLNPIQLKKCIEKKEKSNLTVLYELIESQKIKKEKEEKLKKINNQDHFFKLKKITNEQEQMLKNFRKSLCGENYLETNDWKIGITCQKECFFIMTEILKSLQINNFEWKIISSSYKIRARKINDKNLNTNKTNQKQEINLMIQIFSV